MDLASVKEILLTKYDPDDIIEALDISSEELLDAFEEKLLERLYRFEEDLEDNSSSDPDGIGEAIYEDRD